MRTRYGSVAHYLIEVRGKFYFETDQDPSNIPADVYARVSEAVRSDDDILDIEIETYSLPTYGASD